MPTCVGGDKAISSFCCGFNNSCVALIPAFHCVRCHLTLFSTQLFWCSSLSSRKVPLKVSEAGLRSDGLVPAADVEFFGFCASPFSRTPHSPVAFFPSPHTPSVQAGTLHQNSTCQITSCLAQCASAALKRLANVTPGHFWINLLQERQDGARAKKQRLS